MAIKMKEQFPALRRTDPKRLAEARVYDALTRMALDGHGLYEFRYRDDGQQVDFPLWLHGMGRFAIEVKGGHYEMPSPGEWVLTGPEGGRATVPSPLDQAADGAVEMRNAILKATGFPNFIAAVLLFPDMERDARIENAARNASSVHTVWGVEGLAESLQCVAARAEFWRPPLSKVSANEWSKVYELQYREPCAPNPLPEGDGDSLVQEVFPLSARQVVIQHVEHLHLHTSAVEGIAHG